MRVSEFDVKKALLDHLVANSQGFLVIPEGSDEQGVTGETYLAESVLYGPVNITIDPGGKDNLQGIYQVDVCTPIVNGDFYNLGICETLATSFGKARSANIQHDGQWVEIQNIDISSMTQNDAETHLVHYVSVSFRAV